jgi:hypothetical protein
MSAESVVAPVDFRPRRPVIRDFDHPALQGIAIRISEEQLDRVVRWREPEPLEIPANPLVRWVLRVEFRMSVPDA